MPSQAPSPGADWPELPRHVEGGVGAEAPGAREDDGEARAAEEQHELDAAIGGEEAFVDVRRDKRYHDAPQIPMDQHARRVELPCGVAVFPRDIAIPPRSWADRTSHIVHWTEMPRGGHFAPFEEPELYAEDLRAFFRSYRGG